MIKNLAKIVRCQKNGGGLFHLFIFHNGNFLKELFLFVPPNLLNFMIE
jgi:hypothetical protein